ncbi:MAG: hypothetical protein ACTSO5_08915, partial [Candidatus Heimdallarchaeaceae archaeon]
FNPHKAQNQILNASESFLIQRKGYKFSNQYILVEGNEESKVSFNFTYLFFITSRFSRSKYGTRNI